MLKAAPLWRIAGIVVVACGVGACGGGGGGGGTPGTGDTGAPGRPDTQDGRDAVAPEPDQAVDETGPGPCTPQCAGRDCGDDGCGGRCGSCFDAQGGVAPELCIEGVCCHPQCVGRNCGDDGCGGTCGSCFDAQGGVAPELCVGGVCQPPPCQPYCGTRNCGDDGCGGSCGSCFNAQGALAPELCQNGTCCVPNCAARCCGDDGCGGSCPDLCSFEGLVCRTEACGCGTMAVCGGNPVPPNCPGALAPAPTTSAGVAAFVRDNAYRLRCTSGGRTVWDFDGLALAFEDMQLFMFGEIHGTNELGTMSADLFEDFVRRGLVNALTMETLGMDAADALAQYIRTGGGPLVNMYSVEYMPSVMFVRTLCERARALYLDGYPVESFLVEAPMRLAWVNEQIEGIAARLPATTRALALEGLPAAKEIYQTITLTYMRDAREYYDHVHENIDTICATFDDATCERFEQLANALWLGAFTMSGAMDQATDSEVMAFFAYRETLLDHNYRRGMPDDARRVYTHMGAAHCAKGFSAFAGYANVAARLNTVHPPTQGRVYTTTPAYGDGSRIRYGGQIYNQAAEPPEVANALANAAGDRYAVSTNLPGSGCVESPLTDILSDSYVNYADSYDQYTYVRQLTPEPAYYKSADLPVGARRLIERYEAMAVGRKRLARILAALPQP